MGNRAIVLTVELGVAVFAGLVSLLGGATVPVALSITGGTFVVAIGVGMVWKRMTASPAVPRTRSTGNRVTGSSGAAGGAATFYDGGWSPPSDSSGGGDGGGGGSY